MKRNAPLRSHSTLKRSGPMLRRTRLKPRSKTNSYRRRERDFEFMGWVKRQPCIVRALPPVPAGLHAFKPHSQYPWFCGDCGYAEHEPLKHPTLTSCSGPVEADHAGERGVGQKADDRTCIPLCRNHHRERTDHMRTFRPLTRDELRAWRTAAIEHTQAAWRNR